MNNWSYELVVADVLYVGRKFDKIFWDIKIMNVGWVALSMWDKFDVFNFCF